MATAKKFNVRHGLSAGSGVPKDVISGTGLVYDVGILSTLKTIAKNDTVTAINEIYDSLIDIADINETNEPMGVLDRAQSIISFNNTTKTFSIALAPGKSEFIIWTAGVRRIYTTTQSVSIGASPSTGLYYIYFNTSGVLSYKTTYFDWPTETPIAYIYWNATTAKAEFVADERHGIVLDWQTHEYLHRTRGAVIANGFSISAYTTTGDGSLDAHAQFDLSNGTFFDEDLEVNITHSATPTNGTFTQVLTGAAEIPVFYINGSEGAWIRDVATEFACKQSETTLQYNSLSGTTWSTTSATNNRYVVSWIVATNDIYAPVIAILGQAEYTDIGGAEAALFGDLVLTNFPIFEFRPLWKVIFRTSTGYTNTPNAYISSVLDLREMSSTGTGGSIVSDHGLLTGLADDDHSQYLHTTFTRAGITANISTTGNLGGANLTLTGELRGPSTLVIDPATVGDDTGLVRIKGDLEVLGATTNINSTTLVVEDKNIILGDTSSPTDLSADGGGITLKGTTDKTFAWLDATDAWTSSERISIPLGSDGAPSLTFTGDPNTGIYSPDADQIAISTNGSGRVFVDSSGRLLVGTSNTSSSSTIVVQGNSGSSSGQGILRIATGTSSPTNLTPIGTIAFTDNGHTSAAQITAQRDGGTWTSGSSQPTRLTISTTADGTNSPTEHLRVTSAGLVGIGTTNPGFKLEVNGSFAATTKSFLIDHPTKEGHKLRYGSLEGPENGVYVRGRSTDSVIELPEYWVKLVDQDSITVNLTPIGQSQSLWVKDIKDNKIYIESDSSDTNYFYIVFAERIDVDKLKVETEVH